jgi:spermidine/putrescine transport system ATP-binding protein
MNMDTNDKKEGKRSEPMVRIQNLQKTFGDFTALKPLTLDILAGEFLTFLGPSGCGKTTLLRLISGFEEPTAGTIQLDGVDVTSFPPHQRDVNQVFQSYALFPHLNVRENIEFGLKMKGISESERKSRVMEAIELIRLQGMEKRRPTQLSGGQRQRVAMARAIVCRPKVLLLDEPLSALDAQLRHQMQVELKRIQSKLGITFVFVTHDQEEALAMSDRILVMNRGEVEQIGTPLEIYQKPATPFVASFIGSSNRMGVEEFRTESGELSARVASGRWISLGNREKPDEGKYILSIRPEGIDIGGGTSKTNEIEGRVIQVLFRGDQSHLFVQDTLGTEWRIAQPALQKPSQVGDSIRWTVAPSEVTLIREK